MNKEQAVVILENLDFNYIDGFTQYYDTEQDALKVVLTDYKAVKDKLANIEDKLKKDIENITEKLNDREYRYNDILKTRLKAFRTKSKEILKEIE